MFLFRLNSLNPKLIIFDEYDLILLGFDDIYAIYNEPIRFSLENNFFQILKIWAHCGGGHRMPPSLKSALIELKMF